MARDRQSTSGRFATESHFASSNECLIAIYRCRSTILRRLSHPPIMWPFTRWSRIQRALDDARKEFDTLKVLAAQPLVQNVRANKLVSSLHETEFKVFSQFGDDGIIQYLIHRLAPLLDS